MGLANKQSVLDSKPCIFLKQLLPVLLLSLNAYLNYSLRQGLFPTIIKMTIVTLRNNPYNPKEQSQMKRFDFK